MVACLLTYYHKNNLMQGYMYIPDVYIFQIVPVSQCKIANWQSSLEREGWSKCPQPNTYLKGLWRNEKGDESVGRIELGLCCQAQEKCYTREPATCSNVNWKTLLDGWVTQIWCYRKLKGWSDMFQNCTDFLWNDTGTVKILEINLLG